jgi:hypothetical protein
MECAADHAHADPAGWAGRAIRAARSNEDLLNCKERDGGSGKGGRGAARIVK